MFVPDGAKVRRLRKARGYRQEDCEGPVRVCALRTLKRVEKGLPAFESTLSAIAVWLGVEVTDIVVPEFHLGTALVREAVPQAHLVQRICVEPLSNVLLRAASPDTPDDLDSAVRLVLSVSSDMRGDSDAAISILEPVTTRPNVPSALSRTAKIRTASFYDHHGSPAEALAILDRLLRRETLDADSHWWASHQLGVVLISLDRLDEAEYILDDVYRNASRRDQRTSALHQIGTIAVRRNDYARAETYFSQCIECREANGSDFRTAYEHRRLGLVYAQTARRAQAVEAFDRALFVARRWHFTRYINRIEDDLRLLGMLQLAG